MQLKSEGRTGFHAELELVPRWAWGLAGFSLVAAQLMFDVVLAHQPGGPPLWVRPLLGIAAGALVGCYFLFLGYVNRDARRRGMSPALWTIVSVLIPNGLGFVLYFVLRKPRHRVCRHCGNETGTEFNFCPRCGNQLSPNCPACQRIVSANDVYCPHCGTALRNRPAQQAGAARETHVE